MTRYLLINNLTFTFKHTYTPLLHKYAIYFNTSLLARVNDPLCSSTSGAPLASEDDFNIALINSNKFLVEILICKLPYIAFYSCWVGDKCIERSIILV